MPICVTAGDPFCAGCHPELVPGAVVANHSANGVGPMTIVIARRWRVVTARVADAVVDGVMPVVVVISVLSVPAAVVRFKCLMCPADASVRAGHYNSLAGKSQRPDLRGVRVSDSRFDCFRSLRLQRRANSRE